MSRRYGSGGATLRNYRSIAYPKARARGQSLRLYRQRGAYRQRWGDVIPRPRFRRGYDRTGGYYRGAHSHKRPELKFHDDAINILPIPNTGHIFSTTVAIPQGTGESERIGRKCVVKSWSMRYALTLQEQTLPANTHDEVKIFIMQDRQTNGTVALILDVLEQDNIHSYRNLANTGRFKVLATRSHCMSNPAGGNSNFGTNIQKGQFHIKMFMPLEYSSTTGSLTELKSNNIFMLLISLDSRTHIQGRIRVRFEG